MGVTHDLSGDDLSEAIGVLEAQLAPCGAKFAEPMVQAMKASLAQRNRDGDDLKTWALLMLMELGDLPGDLVRKSCREWLLTQKWLPTLAELIAEMQPELRKRQLTLAALRKPLPDAVPLPQTPERIQADQVEEIMRRATGKNEEERAAEIVRRPVDPPPPRRVNPGQSLAQKDAEKAKDKAVYWLEMMSAG